MDPVGVGVFLRPAADGTLQLFIGEGAGVALGALVWIASIVLGLVTAWLVLP